MAVLSLEGGFAHNSAEVGRGYAQLVPGFPLGAEFVGASLTRFQHLGVHETASGEHRQFGEKYAGWLNGLHGRGDRAGFLQASDPTASGPRGEKGGAGDQEADPLVSDGVAEPVGFATPSFAAAAAERGEGSNSDTHQPHDDQQDAQPISGLSAKGLAELGPAETKPGNYKQNRADDQEQRGHSVSAGSSRQIPSHRRGKGNPPFEGFDSESGGALGVVH